jgi:hypothetical protein
MRVKRAQTLTQSVRNLCFRLDFSLWTDSSQSGPMRILDKRSATFCGKNRRC